MQRFRHGRLKAVVTVLWCVAALGLSGGLVRAQSADEAFSLPYLLVGAPGTSVSYVITQIARQVAVEVTGLFLLAGVDIEEMREEEVIAIGVRYTVLEADPAAGTARLAVQAQALDPASYEPLLGMRWEGTYLLTRAGAEWESGHNIPETYAAVLAPDWLGDWSLTEAGALPQGPLEPGASWQAVTVSADANLFVGEAALPVTGTFVGWESLRDGTRVARVTETGTTSASVQAEIESLPVNVQVSMDVAADMLLIPEGFPYELRQRAAGDMTMSIAVDSLSGDLRFDMLFERAIIREEAGPDVWFSPYDVLEIYPGESLTGSLGSWSHRLNDGTPFDYYVFSGSAGQVATILLESGEFDAYLVLLDEESNILAEDDDSGGNGNARISLTLPYTGYYAVIANAYSQEAGSYTLTVELGDPQ